MLLLSIITALSLYAFLGLSVVLFAPVGANTAPNSHLFIIFWGGVVAIMAAMFILVRANKVRDRIVQSSSFARATFGVDVSLVSFAFAAMIGRFFVMNAGGYNALHAFHYASLGVVGVASFGLAVLGIAVAAGLIPSSRIFSVLRKLDK